MSYVKGLSEFSAEWGRYLYLQTQNQLSTPEGQALTQLLQDRGELRLAPLEQFTLPLDSQSQTVALVQARQPTEHQEETIQLKSGLTPCRYPNQDFFLADLTCYALKEDRHGMESPLFTLSTKPDTKIWTWTSADGRSTIEVVPSVKGRATQHDKDILIYLTSQMTKALDSKKPIHRTVRMATCDFLTRTERGLGGIDYVRLHEAFNRLAGTRISTNIKTGHIREYKGFGLIEAWSILERSPRDERRTVTIEVTLSDWLYRAIQHQEILTLHRDYFRIRSPIGRRLYELARKHCGKQTAWKIDLDLLQQKTGSQSTLKEFRRALAKIAQDPKTLLEYTLTVLPNQQVEFRPMKHRVNKVIQ